MNRLREFTEKLMNDLIDEWHEVDDAAITPIELHELLGLTKEEYSLYVENPDKFFDYLDERSTDE